MPIIGVITHPSNSGRAKTRVISRRVASRVARLCIPEHLVAVPKQICFTAIYAFITSFWIFVYHNVQITMRPFNKEHSVSRYLFPLFCLSPSTRVLRIKPSALILTINLTIHALLIKLLIFSSQCGP
jgi:hypothetical protein